MSLWHHAGPLLRLPACRPANDTMDEETGYYSVFEQPPLEAQSFTDSLVFTVFGAIVGFLIVEILRHYGDFL
jgi:hypothetical protein